MMMQASPSRALPEQPVLYSFRRCPYAMRARLAIAVCNIPVELREVLLRDKPAHMIALSPKATVPVLWLPDGDVIDESLDVMRWARAQGTEERLRETAADTELIGLVDTKFKHHLDRYKYASRYPGEDGLAHRDAAMAILAEIEARLGRRAPDDWLGGAQPGFADLAILPFVRQFRIADPKWFDACGDIRRVQKWLQRFLDWPGFLAVMEKYPQWHEGEPGVSFAPKMPSLATQ